jgi:hypothetical protein
VKAVGLEPTTYGLKVRCTDASKLNLEATCGKSPENLAHSLACELQNLAQPALDPLDLATAAAALAKLPEADRRAGLDTLADALRDLPIAERARLAGRLLDNQC